MLGGSQKPLNTVMSDLHPIAGPCSRVGWGGGGGHAQVGSWSMNEKGIEGARAFVLAVMHSCKVTVRRGCGRGVCPLLLEALAEQHTAKKQGASSFPIVLPRVLTANKELP